MIYDYKTGANPSVKDIRQAHNLQLQVYLWQRAVCYLEKRTGLRFITSRTEGVPGFGLNPPVKGCGSAKAMVSLVMRNGRS